MTDEEKEAIKNIKKEFEKNHILPDIANEDLGILLNLIEKQSKEIEHQKEKRENQKQELAILNAKQIEFNKLVNTVNSYKGQFKRQQKEIEELKEENKEIREWKYVIDNPIDLKKLSELDIIKIFGKSYIAKDIIKARIKELEEYLYRGSIKDDFLMIRIKAKIQELQSLLEKE